MSSFVATCSLFTLVFVLGYSRLTAGFDCYACTYLFSGNEGKLNYECVNDTANFVHTRTLQCELPKQCIIRTVYEEDYARLLSMSKSCEVPEKPENKCYTDGTVRPTCFLSCQTDHCNGVSGDMKPEGTGFPTGKGATLVYPISSLCTGILVFLSMQSI